MSSALSATFGDSSPKGGATGVSVRPHSLRGVLFYQKQKCSAVQIHDILISIIVQKLLFLTTAHCILRHICFQQSAQSFPACQSLSLWERWHCEAMTERASPAGKSRCAAMGRLFVRAILSQCLGFAVSGLALSVSSQAPRQLPQRGSHWHVGQLSSGRAKHNISETAVLRCLGQRQLDKERCPEAAALCSKARPFTPCRASGVQ